MAHKRDHDYLRTFAWVALLGEGFVAIALLLRLLFRPVDSKHLNEQKDEDADSNPPEASQKPPEPKTKRADSWLNWDVIGLTSAAITIAAAAIFYLAGWVYEARWYGYYGLEVGQFGLAPHQVMIQGVPGILLLLLCLGFSFIWFGLTRLVAWQWPPSQRLLFPRNDLQSVQWHLGNVPYVVLRAYLLALLAVFGAAAALLIGTPVSQVPWEALLSGIIGLIVLSIAQILGSMESLLNGIFAASSGTRIPFSMYAWIGAMQIRAARFVLHRPRLRRMFGLQMSTLSKVETDRMREQLHQLGIEVANSAEPDEVLQRAIHAVGQASLRLYRDLSLYVSRLWLGPMLLLFLLISVAASALLGSYDACRGGRSLSGNWHVPQAVVSVDTPSAFLSKEHSEMNSSGTYGPVGLLAMTDGTIFMTDWKETVYFERQPRVYAIPRSSVRAIQISPKGTVHPVDNQSTPSVDLSSESHIGPSATPTANASNAE